MPKLSKSKKWVRNLILSLMIRERCLKNLKQRWMLIRMRSTWESSKFKNSRRRWSKRTTISKCTSSDSVKWMRECKILRRNLSLNPEKIIVWEIKLQTLKNLWWTFMDQEKVKALSMLSWITWRRIMRNLLCSWKKLPITKTSKTLRSWEKPSTYLNKVSEIYVTLSVLRRKLVRLKPRIKICRMQTNGSQLRLSKKSKNSKWLIKEKCLKLAYLRSFTSLILFGGTSWGKRTRQSKENSLSKFKTSVDSLWPRRHLMRMNHKERSRDWRKSSNSYKCKFTIKRGKHSKMKIKISQTCQMHPKTS